MGAFFAFIETVERNYVKWKNLKDLQELHSSLHSLCFPVHEVRSKGEVSHWNTLSDAYTIVFTMPGLIHLESTEGHYTSESAAVFIVQVW